MICHVDEKMFKDWSKSRPAHGILLLIAYFNSKADVSSRAKCKRVGLNLHLQQHFLCARSEGSVNVVRLRRLAGAYAAYIREIQYLMN